MQPQGRAERVDFYRGLALVFMFWDHIPSNIMGYVSVRNFGLSDAAEIFVFLSGYSAVIAYGRLMKRDGYGAAVLRILRRVWKLYVVHIFLFAVLLGTVFVLDDYAEGRDFISEMRLGYFVSDTQRVLIEALLLRFKPNLMDPLPLYIVLMLGLIVLLPVLLRRPAWAVALSFLLYCLVQIFDWNLPGQTGEHWFFNPLAWQFLFVLGGACAANGYYTPANPHPVPRPLYGVAAVFLVSCAVLALSWRVPGLHDLIMPEWLAAFLYPISKTNISPVRLLHFVVLAALVAALIPAGAWMESRFGRLMRLLGRHALEVFCFSVVLAPLADVLGALGDDLWLIHVLVAFAGVVLMAGLALLLEWPSPRRFTVPPAATR